MMSDEKRNFVSVVDLSRYFCDHRRVARIFIKKHIKTIQDLQNRISETFGIDGFHLTTGGQFLPISEDIRVLSNGETVCVTPDNSDAAKTNSNVNASTSFELNTSARVNRKRALDDIPEESSQTSSPKKKKNKKHHISVEYASNSGSQDEEPCNNESLKHSKSSNNAEDEISHSRKEKNKKSKKQGLVEKEVCDIETAHKISEIKKKFKRKADEYSQKQPVNSPMKSTQQFSSLKTVLPKLQSHIKNCNNLGRSSAPNIVRLSRHEDTPIKTFTKYIPPQRSTDQYLAEHKINIVKIDVIKGELAKLSTDTENTENRAENNTSTCLKDPNSPPENYVKTVVDSLEKNISPKDNKTDPIVNGLSDINENKSGQKQNQASNYTKAYLDKTDVDEAPISESKTSRICSIPSTDCPTSFQSIIGESNPESEQLERSNLDKSLTKEAPAPDGSLDISSIAQDSLISPDASFNSAINLINTSTGSNNSASPRSKKGRDKRLLSGIGPLVESLRDSDSVLSQESDTSTQYVTKRKRIRNRRKRQSKKTEENKQAEPPVFASPVILAAQAAPNIHIKFDVDTAEEKIDLVEDDASKRATINKEMCQKENNLPKSENAFEKSSVSDMVLSDETEDPIMENKAIFDSYNILRAPLMESKLEPRIGDIIAFKILKMTENYTPHISDYIIGRVDVYNRDSQTVRFKILSGKKELAPVTGKLSLNLAENEDIQHSKYREFIWSEIFEPKLLYP